MSRNPGSGALRIRHLLPLGAALLLASAALLGACSRASSVQAPRQTPEQLMTAQMEALKQENEALRAEQQDSARQVEALNKQIASDRDEQKKFRQMMSTNFDLLEQSVSLTLARSVDKPAVEKSAADKSLDKASVVKPGGDAKIPGPGAPTPVLSGTEPTPPGATARVHRQEPSHDVPMAAGLSPANPSVGAADGASIAPAAPKTSGAAADSKVAANVAAKMTAKSGAKAAGKPAVAGAAAEKDTALNDPDLQPPRHPKQLTANRAAKPLYERGFTLYGNGQFEQAIMAYQNFLSRYPQDIYSDNAQFWIGESYLQLNKLDEAEAAYRKVLREYEHKSTLEGYKTPDAIYRLGTLYAKRHKGKRAREYLEVVAQRFPDSSAGHKAQRELEGNGPLAQSGDIAPVRGG